MGCMHAHQPRDIEHKEADRSWKACCTCVQIHCHFAAKSFCRQAGEEVSRAYCIMVRIVSSHHSVQMADVFLKQDTGYHFPELQILGKRGFSLFACNIQNSKSWDKRGSHFLRVASPNYRFMECQVLLRSSAFNAECLQFAPHSTSDGSHTHCLHTGSLLSLS